MRTDSCAAVLRDTFTGTALSQGTDPATVAFLWQPVRDAYTHPDRHYHNLHHLCYMLQELERVKTAVANWQTIVMALFYHDLVYDITRQDNEEQSSAASRTALQLTGMPAGSLDSCCRHILATKSHQLSGDTDTDLFTDADLSILGAPAAEYLRYAANVRREYARYPDLLYHPGRRKVLQHFLDLPRIFKTAPFYDRLEDQARANLAAELATLHP